MYTTDKNEWVNEIYNRPDGIRNDLLDSKTIVDITEQCNISKFMTSPTALLDNNKWLRAKTAQGETLEQVIDYLSGFDCGSIVLYSLSEIKYKDVLHESKSKYLVRFCLFSDQHETETE